MIVIGNKKVSAEYTITLTLKDIFALAEKALPVAANCVHAQFKTLNTPLASASEAPAGYITVSYEVPL